MIVWKFGAVYYQTACAQTSILFFCYIYNLSDEDSTEGIPEGFFDDPKLDAKVC